MFKKLCLSLALTTLSISASVTNISQLTVVQSSLAHIAQEKKAIHLDLSNTISFGLKAIQHMQSKLADDYISCAEKVTTLINIIFASEEFNYSIERVTDLQVACIADKGMHFEDITYNPSDYPINDKINSDVAPAFSILGAHTEQLFNILYVISANARGSQLLLEKLELIEQELTDEKETLIASIE